jgi:ATP-dependent helicase/nuclease subunit A
MTQDATAKITAEPLRKPGEDQAAAANPLKSVWVGASAGTGKTKVLIDRVLRLMLPRDGMDADSATRPEKVLCLTFTKTAAAEMSNRIYQRLARWAVIEDVKLEGDLASLLGAPASKETVQEARRLFARVLDTPGGLKIMTIHSFCQSVLKRFPVEAGLPPHFELMDEQSAVEYLLRCQHDMIAAAANDPQSPVAAAFSLLALHLDQSAMSDLMSKIMAKRSLLAAIFAKHGDTATSAQQTIAAVYKHLELAPDMREETVLQNVGQLAPEAEVNLRHALRVLLEGSKTDLDKAACMQPWLENASRRGALLHLYRGAFFTTTGDIRKTLATKKVKEAYPDIEDVMIREAERLQGIEDQLAAVRLAELNGALLTVAAEMVGRYERHKQATDKLDFDDLIIRTSALLDTKGMVGWVLYKLDEGIDHILVDEAQDTSPSQWRVVRAIADEFLAGRGARDDATRTLFVVGDEKQSIFSFQGADPAAFAEMQDYFGGKVKNIQEGWEIFLEYSFRSTRTVLEVVDGVFGVADVRRGVVADMTRDVLHRPFRTGHAGVVEVWPLVQAQVSAEAEPWQMPVDIEPGDNAGSRLAKKMAETIKDWLDRAEMLESRGRPIKAGDVLILVQSRSALVEMIMRALKEHDVPVAGIDRMTLTEEISVMDLLAVAGFALQPRDDLTLATVLKSPLIGVSEDELFTLCHGRKANLWDVVRDQRPDIAAWLKTRIDRSGYSTPYEFFAEILNTACVADDRTGRRALYARLGMDIQDALDEFLNACLHFEQSHTPSLQTFVSWFLRGEAQIKREQDAHKQDQVRIMTVHASKGLQAPIVFLPDTVKVLHDHNKGRVRLLWPAENAVTEGAAGATVPLWSPRKEFDAKVYADAQGLAADKQMEEYRRLLYVALTRAEDRLYIAGYYGKNKPKEGCWYNLVQNAFPATAEAVPFMLDGAALTDESGTALMARKLTHPQTVPPVLAAVNDETDTAEAVRKPLPDFAIQPPQAEPVPPLPLAPSKPGEDEPAAKGPLGIDDGWRFKRGVIVHHILEVLPQLPPEKWPKTLASWLARPALALPVTEQKVFADEILRVLQHPDFAPIFGAGSRAEVPVVGLAGKNIAAPKILSGQIDRLCVTADEVLVVDYKTNRPPPKDESAVATVYLKQMAAYRSLLQKIYPDKTVRCALLWTDGPHLMPLSEKLLDPHAP